MSQKDPTTLNCFNCGQPYELNCARVIRSLTGSETGRCQTETSKLCWVCERLYHSVQQEMKTDQESSC